MKSTTVQAAFRRLEKLTGRRYPKLGRVISARGDLLEELLQLGWSIEDGRRRGPCGLGGA